MKLFKRDKTFTKPIVWLTTFFVIAFHVGAVAALFMFAWKPFVFAILLWWVAGSLGIGMGFHRLLTHRGYKTTKLVEYVLTVCGTLSLEGGPIFWVATHRLHHQNADKDGDPHSPRDGGLWAHMGWIITGRTLPPNEAAELLPYVPDLRRDKFHVWISKWHWVPLTALGLALLALGGWPYLLWGVFFRTVVGLHCTWLVNSATHMWGSQRFQTHDNSRNSFWVAMLTFGEGWHNNHHAKPQSPRHGLAWYEFDLNWYGICAMRMVRLAWDLKVPSTPERRWKHSMPQPAERRLDRLFWPAILLRSASSFESRGMALPEALNPQSTGLRLSRGLKEKTGVPYNCSEVVSQAVEFGEV
jgi:stearoyl-CoA desaturase (delta-9 desaturase)